MTDRDSDATNAIPARLTDLIEQHGVVQPWDWLEATTDQAEFLPFRSIPTSPQATGSVWFAPVLATVLQSAGIRHSTPTTLRCDAAQVGRRTMEALADITCSVIRFTIREVNRRCWQWPMHARGVFLGWGEQFDRAHLAAIHADPSTALADLVIGIGGGPGLLSHGNANHWVRWSRAPFLGAIPQPLLKRLMAPCRPGGGLVIEDRLVEVARSPGGLALCLDALAPAHARWAGSQRAYERLSPYDTYPWWVRWTPSPEIYAAGWLPAILDGEPLVAEDGTWMQPLRRDTAFLRSSMCQSTQAATIATLRQCAVAPTWWDPFCDSR